jgi:[NiFe] hydrogenase assembly HybE family chaperone
METFRAILHERMADLPFLNPALTVEAVGFTRFRGHWLGILITPWSMNLMLLPGADGDWLDLHESKRQQWHFPAGDLKFVAAREAAIGSYQQCPLFNAMHQFADQESARDAASAALQALFEPAAPTVAEPAPPQPLADIRTKPLSKRDFLRGRFLPEKQP